MLRLDQLDWLPRPPMVPEALKPTVTPHQAPPRTQPKRALAGASCRSRFPSRSATVSSPSTPRTSQKTCAPESTIGEAVQRLVGRQRQATHRPGDQGSGVAIDESGGRRERNRRGCHTGYAWRRTTTEVRDAANCTAGATVPTATPPSEGAKPGKGCLLGVLGGVLVMGVSVGRRSSRSARRRQGGLHHRNRPDQPNRGARGHSARAAGSKHVRSSDDEFGRHRAGQPGLRHHGGASRWLHPISNSRRYAF